MPRFWWKAWCAREMKFVWSNSRARALAGVIVVKRWEQATVRTAPVPGRGHATRPPSKRSMEDMPAISRIPMGICGRSSGIPSLCRRIEEATRLLPLSSDGHDSASADTRQHSHLAWRRFAGVAVDTESDLAVDCIEELSCITVMEAVGADHRSVDDRGILNYSAAFALRSPCRVSKTRCGSPGIGLC